MNKQYLILAIIIPLIGGCGLKIPKKIDLSDIFVTEDETSEDAGDTADIGSEGGTDTSKLTCRKSKLIGTWVNYDDYDQFYYLEFEEDCSVVSAYCQDTYLMSQNNNDKTGEIKLEVMSEPVDAGCFEKGVHDCNYGRQGNLLYLSCDGEEEPETFYKVGF